MRVRGALDPVASSSARARATTGSLRCARTVRAHQRAHGSPPGDVFIRRSRLPYNSAPLRQIHLGVTGADTFNRSGAMGFRPVGGTDQGQAALGQSTTPGGAIRVGERSLLVAAPWSTRRDVELPPVPARGSAGAPAWASPAAVLCGLYLIIPESTDPSSATVACDRPRFSHSARIAVPANFRPGPRFGVRRLNQYQISGVGQSNTCFMGCLIRWMTRRGMGQFDDSEE